MEVLFEIIVARFIIRFLGVRTRYVFFKIIGSEKSIKQLRGDDNGYGKFALNDLSNLLVGFIVFAILSITIFYLINLAGLL